MHRFPRVLLHNVRAVRLLVQVVWFVTCPFPDRVFPGFVVLSRVAVRSFAVVPVVAFGTVRFVPVIDLPPLQYLLPSLQQRWLPVRFPLRVPAWWVLPCVWLLRQPFR